MSNDWVLVVAGWLVGILTASVSVLLKNYLDRRAAQFDRDVASMRPAVAKPLNPPESSAVLLDLRGQREALRAKTLAASAPSCAPSVLVTDKADKTTVSLPRQLVARIVSLRTPPPVSEGRLGRWPLEKVTRIGRDKSMDIVLPSPHVSRLHAQIVNSEGGFYLYDMGSSNGTWIKGRKVGQEKPVKLQSGCLIWFADYPLEFREVSTNRVSRD